MSAKKQQAPPPTWQATVLDPLTNALRSLLPYTSSEGITPGLAGGDLLAVEAITRQLRELIVTADKMLSTLESKERKRKEKSHKKGGDAEKDTHNQELIDRYHAEFASLDIIVSDILTYEVAEERLRGYIECISIRPSFAL